MNKIILTLLLLIISCSKSGQFGNKLSIENSISSNPEKDINEPVIDIPKPKVLTNGVVTILLALGDYNQSSLVISQESAMAIAQNAISYATPVANPKILVIKDWNHNFESVNDTIYIQDTLLQKYQTDIMYLDEATSLIASDLDGYDMVWFNNPGHPMGNVETRNVLINFNGGVVLSGDDLSGNVKSRDGDVHTMTELTGLKYIDNGTVAKCSVNGNDYSIAIDNNQGSFYQIVLESNFLENVESAYIQFQYGNDIDNSQLIAGSNKYEVLAHAYAPNGSDCEGLAKRPVIVRYEK